MKEQLVITKNEGKGYTVMFNNMTVRQLAKMIGWFVRDYITKKGDVK